MTDESDEKIEKLVDQRVKELKQEFKEEKKEIRKEAQKEIQEVKNEVEKLKADSNSIKASKNKSENHGISRRDFLKKAGLGTAGLAALMSPVSALNLKSDSLSFSDSNQEYLNINTNNNEVNIQNADLNLNNQGIKNIGSLELPVSPASDNHRIWLDTDKEKLKIKIEGNTYTSEIRPTIPESGVSHWKFEENTDTTTAVDAWGYSDITHNSTGYTSNSYSGDYALEFTDYASTQYAQTSDKYKFMTETGNFTIAMWLYPTNMVQYNTIYDSGNSTGVNLLINPNGDLYCRIWTDGNDHLLDDDGVLTSDVWQHLVITFDGDELSSYYNGSFSKSKAGGTTTTTEPDNNFRLGADPDTFEGYMDDVRVYDKPLSSTEISNLYNNGSISG